MLDSNLLILLVAGQADRRIVSRHKRLKHYSVDDYDLLERHVSTYSKIVLLPNIVTEAANLLSQTHGQDLLSLRVAMAKLLENVAELYTPSLSVTALAEYINLGMTDAAILSVLTPGMVLLTDDLDLYVAARIQKRAAEQFSYLRDPPAQ